MPFVECRSCGGKGTVKKGVQRQITETDSKGKKTTRTVTEQVDMPCSGCRGSGVISK